MNTKLILLLLSCCCLFTGCKPMGYLLYLFAPEGKKVEAEYDGLPGHSVAVIIFVGPDIEYEYPFAKLELSALICDEMQKRLKKVTVIDPRIVAKYQDENLNWDSMDKTALGKAMEADYVLFISLLEFTMREPGSVNLYRGQISAEVSLYQTDQPERSARVWFSRNIRVIFPKDAPLGQIGQDDSKIRYATEKLFTDALVKKFYKHQEEETK